MCIKLPTLIKNILGDSFRSLSTNVDMLTESKDMLNIVYHFYLLYLLFFCQLPIDNISNYCLSSTYLLLLCN